MWCVYATCVFTTAMRLCTFAVVVGGLNICLEQHAFCMEQKKSKNKKTVVKEHPSSSFIFPPPK